MMCHSHMRTITNERRLKDGSRINNEMLGKSCQVLLSPLRSELPVYHAKLAHARMIWSPTESFSRTRKRLRGHSIFALLRKVDSRQIDLESYWIILPYTKRTTRALNICSSTQIIIDSRENDLESYWIILPYTKRTTRPLNVCSSAQS